LVNDRNSLRALLREKFPRNHGQLLPALHFLQHEFSYLPDWAMEVVSWHLGIPASEVYGAATSYTELRVHKPGEHVVRVCTGLSCYQNGASELLNTLESELRAHPGMTTSDGKITLEETPCGFLCGMAPAVEIDGTWRGRVTPDAIKGLIQEVAHS
jgi:NADH:ubiquinone oxidoreductase subunit E